MNLKSEVKVRDLLFFLTRGFTPHIRMCLRLIYYYYVFIFVNIAPARVDTNSKDSNQQTPQWVSFLGILSRECPVTCPVIGPVSVP